MPRGDKTGPAGLGPMTGRGAGFCAGYPTPGYMNPTPGTGWYGYGRGWGRGPGRSRGRGRGWFAYGGYPDYGGPDYGGPGYGYPYAPDITPKQEAKALREQAKAMQEEIKAINSRIAELESEKKQRLVVSVQRLVSYSLLIASRYTLYTKNKQSEVYMRVAISTDGEYVSPHFGRCPSFTIVDIGKGKVVKREVVDNPGHSPGSIPQFLHERGVEVIIAGGMGNNWDQWYNR